MSKNLDTQKVIDELHLLLKHFPDDNTQQWAIYLPQSYEGLLGKLAPPFYFSNDTQKAFIAPSPQFYLDHPESLVSYN